MKAGKGNQEEDEYEEEGKDAAMTSVGSGSSSASNNASRSVYSDRVSISHLTSNPSLGNEKGTLKTLEAIPCPCLKIQRTGGQGANCGFGMRGQKTRFGPGIRKGFEGGQIPIYRRIPKLKGIVGGNHSFITMLAIATAKICACKSEGHRRC